MTKRNEIRESVNNSSVLSTSNSTKTVSYQEFQTEKDCKNQAYAFIIASGGFNAFSEFCKITRNTEDYHGLCLELLSSLIKEG